jgi:hypothetical protein
VLLCKVCVGPFVKPGDGPGQAHMLEGHRDWCLYVCVCVCVCVCACVRARDREYVCEFEYVCVYAVNWLVYAF